MGWLTLLITPLVGSFLGVLIRRLPRGTPVALDRSRCEHCGQTLGPRELVPLLSYLIQHGRCRSCNGRIDPFHPAVELAATAVAAIALAAAGPENPLLWGDVVLGWALLALGWIDAETFRLPDVLTPPLLLAGLAEGVMLPEGLAATPESRALGAIAGWALLAAVARAYRAVRGREGLGKGDAKLLAAGGAWLGVEALPAILLGACICGLILAFAGNGRRLKPDMMLPFGPGPALSIWVLRLARDFP